MAIDQSSAGGARAGDEDPLKLVLGQSLCSWDRYSRIDYEKHTKPLIKHLSDQGKRAFLSRALGIDL